MTDATATDQAKEKVQEAAGQAQEKAQEAASQAKSQFHDQVAQRSTEAGQRVNGTASDLRSVAESLRGEGKDQPAKIADTAAQRAERLGSYLEESDADRILRDVEDYARRQPWVVGLGAAALGFAAARFMKASSDQRYQQSRPQPEQRRLPNGNGGTTPTQGVPGYTAPITATGTPPQAGQAGF